MVINNVSVTYGMSIIELIDTQYKTFIKSWQGIEDWNLNITRRDMNKTNM